MSLLSYAINVKCTHDIVKNLTRDENAKQKLCTLHSIDNPRHKNWDCFAIKMKH